MAEVILGEGRWTLPNAIFFEQHGETTNKILAILLKGYVWKVYIRYRLYIGKRELSELYGTKKMLSYIFK